MPSTADPEQVGVSTTLDSEGRDFFDAFHRFTEPFGFWSGASFSYYSNNGEHVATVGDECRCRGGLPAPKGAFGARMHVMREVRQNGYALGRVVLCCARSTPHAERTLESLVSLALGEMRRMDDESALFAELSASWESLQAVYDLSSDFSSHHDPASLLIKITERTTAIHADINTVLWLEHDSHLRPGASNGTSLLKPRRKEAGAIGDAFMRRESVIYNDAGRIPSAPDAEPELAAAQCLAILPLRTRLATYGVMAAWINVKGFGFDSRTMRLLETLAVHAAMVIENDRLLKESIQNERLKQEIDIGSKIQMELLSGTPPVQYEGIEIGAASISSQKIDGDFYEFIEHGDDCFDIIVGDVMGKGIPAALVGAATKNSFLRAVGRLQAYEHSFRPSAEKIVCWVNRDVTPKLTRLDSFVTVCYTRIDLASKRVTFVDCGHTKTIHYRAATGEITFLEGENVPLGFSEGEVFVEQSIEFNDGDLLFFYSDGVTETRNPSGDMFGEERLAEFVGLLSALPPQRIIDTLIENLFRFTTERKFNDDFTCVAIRFGGDAASRTERERLTRFCGSMSELGSLREFVRTAATVLPAEPLDTESIHELELAATEAFTNVIRHAIGDSAESEITVAARGCDESLELTISHRGQPFDPADVPPPNFDGSVDGGFGLFIIENCVDFVGYSADMTDGSTIRMIKNPRK